MGAEQKQASPGVHQKVACEKESTGNLISQHHKNTNPFFSPKASPATSKIQRKCHSCEKQETLQRKEDPPQDTNLVSKVLAGNGEPLDPGTQSFMSDRFGYNFDQVRIHNDVVAAKSASSINALAYTSGNNIVFNDGQYNPGTSEGKKLLAHELTHVVQQNHGVQSKKIQRLTDAEFEADYHLGEAITNGTMAPDRIMGWTYATNCMRDSFGLTFRFSKAYRGVYNYRPSRDLKGVYVKIEVSFNDHVGHGHCTPLRLLQTVRNTQRGSSGRLETTSPGDATRRERAGFGSRRRGRSRGWRVDTLASSSDPFYSSIAHAAVEGTETSPAILYDVPGDNATATNAGKDFYTCAVCQTSNGSRWIAGCVNWGYYIDSSGNIAFLPATPIVNCLHTRSVRHASQRWDAIDGNTDTGIGFAPD